MKQYNYADKPKAMRETFICPNCGAEVIRRLSKVKNRDLVFCDNECRAEYQQKLARLQKGLMNNDVVMRNELKKMNWVISYAVRYMQRMIPSLTDTSELEQIARITIWENYNAAHNGKGKPENYYISAIKHAILNSLRKTWVCENIDDFERSLGFYDTPERILERKQAVKEILARSAKSYKMLLASTLSGLTHREIAEKFKCTARDVTVNIYNAKKLIKESWL